MSIVLQLAVLLALWLAVWLLPKYLERRVSEAARGAVDKQVGVALADHQHQLEQQLELVRQSLALTRERHSQDYGLFAAKRNEIYAALYGLLERAAGAYGGHFAVISSYREFSRTGKPSLQSLAKSLELITDDERADLQSALDDEKLERAREIATRLHKTESLRSAYRAFVAFKNESILNSLYVSTEVDALIHQAIGRLAALSTFGDAVIDGDEFGRREPSDEYDALRKLLDEMRLRMRTEMTSSFNSTDAA